MIQDALRRPGPVSHLSDSEVITPAYVSSLARCALARASVTAGGRLRVVRGDWDGEDEECSSALRNTMCFKSFLAR